MPERDTSRLELELKNIASLRVEIMHAMTPTDLNCGERCTQHAPFGRNRKISCREAAVSMSHTLARELAAQRDNQYFMFIEDDAVVDSIKLDALIQELFRTQGMHAKALAIHLFPEQYGILSFAINGFLRKLSMIPDYAVGYILNRKALDVFNLNNKNARNEIADWPKFARKIHWFAPFSTPIRHPDNPNSSYLISSRTLRRKSNLELDFRGKFRYAKFLLLGSQKRRYGNNTIDNEKLRTKHQYRIKLGRL